MANNAYAEKLRDPRWQKKRLIILQRDEFTCQSCFDSNSTLHVHHRFYESDCEPWDYDDEILITLCEYCHDVETTDMREAIARLSKAFKRKWLSHDIAIIADAVERMQLRHIPQVAASAISDCLVSCEWQKEAIESTLDSRRARKDG